MFLAVACRTSIRPRGFGVCCDSLGLCCNRGGIGVEEVVMMTTARHSIELQSWREAPQEVTQANTWCIGREEAQQRLLLATGSFRTREHLVEPDMSEARANLNAEAHNSK